MILGGDEISRTQQGNNNCWCQDNELSWYDWNLDEHASAGCTTSRAVRSLRHEHPVFRRESFLGGQRVVGDGVLPDAWWFRTDGHKMTRVDWDQGEPALGLFLNGDAIPIPGPHGDASATTSVPVAVHRHHQATSASSLFRESEWDSPGSSNSAQPTPQPVGPAPSRPATPPTRQSRCRAIRSWCCDGWRSRRAGGSLGVVAGREIELRATYRLQLTREFGFESAGRLLPYLRDLDLPPDLSSLSSAGACYDLDPRLRRDRPLPAFRRRSAGSPMVSRRSRDRCQHAARHGRRARHRSQSHGRGRRRTVFGADATGCAGGSSTSNPRHRRGGGRFAGHRRAGRRSSPGGRPRQVFDADPPADPRLRRARASLDGLRIDHIGRSRRRPGRLPAAASPRRRRAASGSRRFSIERAVCGRLAGVRERSDTSSSSENLGPPSIRPVRPS